MRKQIQQIPLIFESGKTEKLFCDFLFFFVFRSLTRPSEFVLIRPSTPAGPLSQDTLSLGGFFIFRVAA
jgi:hypothetical protein